MAIAANEQEWPEHFPPCCPPADALDAAGAAFRFVKDKQAHPDDMRSWLELGRRSKRMDACTCAALSCFVDLDHIRAARATIPLRQGDSIARIRLESQLGKLKQTGVNQEHFSLWLRRQFHAVTHELFEVIA